MGCNDSFQTFPEKKFTTAKPRWCANVMDIFVLWCSSLLTTVSIILVVLVFHTQATFVSSGFTPTNTLSILQRTISALSVAVVSAVIVVAGKYYVLSKLTGGGIQSRRVALYSSPSIGNLASYLVCHGPELPLLALVVVWTLGLATGLTVNNAWAMVPTAFDSMPVTVPSGPFNAPIAPGSLVVPAFGQLSYVMGSVCSGTAGTVGLIKIGGNLRLASGGPMGVLYYPPLPNPVPGSIFSFPTSLNGFNISVEPLSSIPPSAQNLTCGDTTGNGFGTTQLWYGGGDNRTLSIITQDTLTQTLYRFNASAIILGGSLQSTGNGTEFIPDGTKLPNVMINDQWAQDIANLVCNVTHPVGSGCFFDSSLVDFAVALNLEDYADMVDDPSTEVGIYWSTVLGMVMGAYSSAWWPLIGTTQDVAVIDYTDLSFTTQYGLYILIVNILVSVIMLVVVVRLRMAGRLGGDFLNSSRLLLDPLKSPELFNASLDATVDAAGNPYMSVNEHNEFFLSAQSSQNAD